MSDNRWNVIDGPFTHDGKRVCHCICDCGTEALVNECDIRSGKSKRCRACGSKRAWSNSDTSKQRRYPHIPQEVYEKVAGAVDNAITRCTDPSYRRYSDWGGRGIRVVFATRDLFIEHLLSLPGYDDVSLVLDRMDNDKHYEVGNLRWTTRSESQCNRRLQGGEHGYYMNHGFARCFKRLHDRGVSFKEVAELYCANMSTVRNCVRELET